MYYQHQKSNHISIKVFISNPITHSCVSCCLLQLKSVPRLSHSFDRYHGAAGVCKKSIRTVNLSFCVCAFQSESAIVKERELSLELARIRDEVGKWDTAWQTWHRRRGGGGVSHSPLTVYHVLYSTPAYGMGPSDPWGIHSAAGKLDLVQEQNTHIPDTIKCCSVTKITNIQLLD